MKRRLGKSLLFPNGEKSLKVLKIVTIFTPPLFVFVLELLRYTFFEETRPMMHFGALYHSHNRCLCLF